MKNGILITIGLGIWAVIKLVAKFLRILVQVLTGLIIFFGLYIPLFYVVFGIILLVATDFTFGVMGTDQILYFIGLGLSLVASAIITIRTVIVRPLSQVFAPLRDFIAESREKKARRLEQEEREEYLEERANEYEEAVPYMRRIPRDPYYDSYGRVASRYREPDRFSAPRDSYADPRDPYFGEGYRVPAEEGYMRDDARAYPLSDREDPYYQRGGLRRAPDPEPERPLIYYSRRRPGVLVMEYSDRFELYEEEANGRRLIGTEYKDE